eukprot:70020-Amphidinium_carterae.1
MMTTRCLEAPTCPPCKRREPKPSLIETVLTDLVYLFEGSSALGEEQWPQTDHEGGVPRF